MLQWANPTEFCGHILFSPFSFSTKIFKGIPIPQPIRLEPPEKAAVDQQLRIARHQEEARRGDRARCTVEFKREPHNSSGAGSAASGSMFTGSSSQSYSSPKPFTASSDSPGTDMS